jgi:uncharacterized protein (TIGR02266 family)
VNESAPKGDRRVYVRIPVRLQAVARETEHAVGEIYFLTRDLSLGGLFLESDFLFERGTQFEVTFQLPDSAADCHAVGEVTWAQDAAQNGVPGMGLAFEEMDLASMDRLTAFIRARAGRVTHGSD